jgi:hypothetical protein
LKAIRGRQRSSLWRRGEWLLPQKPVSYISINLPPLEIYPLVNAGFVVLLLCLMHDVPKKPHKLRLT